MQQEERDLLIEGGDTSKLERSLDASPSGENPEKLETHLYALVGRRQRDDNDEGEVASDLLRPSGSI